MFSELKHLRDQLFDFTNKEIDSGSEIISLMLPD
jgi:hypothetical protein